MWRRLESSLWRPWRPAPKVHRPSKRRTVTGRRAWFSPRGLNLHEGADDRVEAFMKKFWLAAAAALILTAMLPDGAFAQRGGFRGGGFGGGGFRGAAMGGGFRGAAMGGGFRGAAMGGGFRGAAMGGGFRGAAMGGGFRGAAMGGGGVRMAAISPGFRSAAIGPGFRSAAIGPRFRSAAIGPAFRTAAVGPRFRTAAIGPGFRRRGFGFPFVAGVGLGLAATYPYYYSGYYSDPCVVWDGYAWVNVCPYSY
jgi:hypothetical protein